MRKTPWMPDRVNWGTQLVVPVNFRKGECTEDKSVPGSPKAVAAEAIPAANSPNPSQRDIQSSSI